MNLIGQYDVAVGDKNRLALPKKIREVLGEKIIITYGFERSLIIVSESNWTKFISELEDSSLFSSNARDAKRFLYGGASGIELDKQGRFILPDYLKAHASIKDDVIFLGLDTYAELWDKSKWETHTKVLESDIEKIAETLINKIEK